MSSNDSKTSQQTPAECDADFHGAAVIDKEGHEVPITEEMVQRACEKLEKDRAKD